MAQVPQIAIKCGWGRKGTVSNQWQTILFYSHKVDTISCSVFVLFASFVPLQLLLYYSLIIHKDLSSRDYHSTAVTILGGHRAGAGLSKDYFSPAHQSAALSPNLHTFSHFCTSVHTSPIHQYTFKYVQFVDNTELKGVGYNASSIIHYKKHILLLWTKNIKYKVLFYIGYNFRLRSIIIFNLWLYSFSNPLYQRWACYWSEDQIQSSSCFLLEHDHNHTFRLSAFSYIGRAE